MEGKVYFVSGIDTGIGKTVATGLMAREVRLGDHWQRTAYGPMLGTLQETGTVVALLLAYFRMPLIVVALAAAAAAFVTGLFL